MTRERWLDELENWLDDEPLERLTESRQYNSLKHFGLYEKALLLTWVHHHDYDDNPLQFVPFFERANRKRLLAEGDKCSYKGGLHPNLSTPARLTGKKPASGATTWAARSVPSSASRRLTTTNGR